MTADADQNTPQIRVIVVNYNAGEMLKRCLEALAVQTIENFEAVVVDNATEDGSLNGAVPDDPRFGVIELNENIGFAAANNRGAEGCAAPWIATLNPDADLPPEGETFGPCAAAAMYSAEALTSASGFDERFF